MDNWEKIDGWIDWMFYKCRRINTHASKDWYFTLATFWSTIMEPSSGVWKGGVWQQRYISILFSGRAPQKPLWLPQRHGHLEDPACSYCFLCFDANLSGSVVINRGQGQKLVSSLAGEFHLCQILCWLGTNYEIFGGDVLSQPLITVKYGKYLTIVKRFFLSGWVRRHEPDQPHAQSDEKI